MTFQTLFVKAHEFGTVCAIKIPDAEPSERDIARLHPQEAQVLSKFKLSRRATWVGGRLALAQACEAFDESARPILNDERGAPVLPTGLTGTLTHKNNIAISLVARSKSSMRLGIDVEALSLRQQSIENMILTDTELTTLNTLASDMRLEFVVSRFSLKESIYKAIDPFVKRYVGFKEVEIEETEEGFETRFRLKNNEGPFGVELRSEKLTVDAEEFVVTSARVTHLVNL
ncbi:MAG: 4'-phosphopantetheinyl transferase superfamily protein [Myxococcota bacterium]|nr:4'-phosphopantetheinyl transferase superfamily protein [Myxococcota bacterium]